MASLVSRGHVDVVVEELRREIGAVRPHQGVELRVNGELPEHGRVSERFEDWTSESRTEVDLSTRAVPETEPHYMATDMACFDDVIGHAGHSSGAIRFSGSPLRASSQFVLNSDS